MVGSSPIRHSVSNTEVIHPPALSGRWHVPTHRPFGLRTRLFGFPASCQSHESIISDNGPQFVAWDFKEFIRIAGMTHVRTSPSHPQSNGKPERWHRSLKSECIRPGTPLSQQDAERLIPQHVDRYNNVRLHSAIGYVARMDSWLAARRRYRRCAIG